MTDKSTRRQPQDFWGDPGRILRAYRYYGVALPEKSLKSRFFLILGRLRKKAYNTHKQLKSWEKVAKTEDFSPIPPGTLSTFVADGYLPLKWFDRFDLPTFKPAVTCPDCGEVHIKKRCTEIAPRYRDLFSMPAEVLRFKIQNREEVL